MKKELMNLYHVGQLKDLALYTPNDNEKYVICFYSGTYVFGYYQYQDQKKQFFKTTTLVRGNFKVQKKTLNNDMFTMI